MTPSKPRQTGGRGRRAKVGASAAPGLCEGEKGSRVAFAREIRTLGVRLDNLAARQASEDEDRQALLATLEAVAVALEKLTRRGGGT